MGSDDDLRVLLHSPALTLDPPNTLAAGARRRARRHQLRNRVGAVGLTLAVAATGLLLGPGLKSSLEDLRNNNDQANAFKPDPRFPAATSEVVTLQRINGADVLTWFQGSRWCTATSRGTEKSTCLGPANPDHKGFSWILPSQSPSLTVDNEHVVAGLVPRGATHVGVHMQDGREYDSIVVDTTRFVVPVWSVRVDDSAYPVEYYVAYDAAGNEVARQLAN